MERNKIKEQETSFLISESKKNPELFERETFIDSPDFLEKIGIFFGKEKNLPLGYLKLWPQDFIVEEKSMFGELETIDSTNLFDLKKPFSEKDPTVYATLVKCKMPTFEATKDLARFLEIDPVKIRSAGIKDADAITSQLISIRGADIKRLEHLHSPYYFLKNIYSGKGTVEVGSLEGNKFTILIRTNTNFEEKQFNQNLEKIKKQGFYNFFYLQRFGSPRFINWFWGLQILKGDYKNAISSFLFSEGQREISYFKNIREEIKKNIGNWDKVLDILKPFPQILQNEIKVVEYLQKYPADFTGALNQISKQVQLWIFAYGSLLFNRKISEYIEKEEAVPEKLPLILSRDENDWLLYSDFLKEDQISYMPLDNLKPFPDIQWKKREINTREKVDIHKVKIIPEGVILSFSLSKGCYATTFLTHLFQLTTGLPPKDISENIIDIKETLGENSIKDLTEKFKDITFSKSADIFGNPE
jgi:TruD family tRNA pseudouridine synthase